MSSRPAETKPPKGDEAKETARKSRVRASARREEIRDFFHPLFAGTGGIDSWLDSETPDFVFERIAEVDEKPLTRSQLNQLLVGSHEAGVSRGFFKYYWKTVPEHIYDVTKFSPFDERWVEGHRIISRTHLRWGLYRFYVDALLCFGNIRSAYRALRRISFEEMARYFESRRIETAALADRGPALPLERISKEDRYLIGEKACKPLEGGKNAAAFEAIRKAYDRHVSGGGSKVVDVKRLWDIAEEKPEQLSLFRFATDGLRERTVSSKEELEQLLTRHERRFSRARNRAVANTKRYLSMVEELDVYVATSMRTRDDFRSMANFCEGVFSDSRLRELEVRYFDPTLSAAEGHLDKGLMECLMVKAAKALVYFAGTSETWGKVVEAGMALSHGKPVIIYCDDAEKQKLYRDIHPLTRLIELETGVAIGALVATSITEIQELINRILRNDLEYELVQASKNEKGVGYLMLKEQLTGSVVRLQTNDRLLSETFWNYYSERGALP